MAKIIEPMDFAPSTGVVPAGFTFRGDGACTISTLTDASGVPANLSVFKISVSSAQSSNNRGFSLNAAGSFGDGQIFARTRGDKTGGVVMRGSGSIPMGGYKVLLDGANLKIWNNGSTQIGSVPFSASSPYYYYNILAEAVGNVIKAMAWKEGDPMPSDWMLTVVDNLHASGFWGGFTSGYNFARYWDEVDIANGGDVLFTVGGRIIQSPMVGQRFSRGSGIQSSQRRIIVV